MSNVTSHDIDAQGNRLPPPTPRYWLAGAVAVALLVLLLRTLFPPLPPSGLPALLAASSIPSTASAPAPASALPALAVVTWTPGVPTPGPSTGATAPATAAPVPATAGCPAAAVLPAAARVGWLARATGCPQLVFANVSGARQWVQRPTSLTDELYFQLPEIQP